MILDLMRRRKRLFAWLFLPLLVVGLVAYLIPGAGMQWGQEIGAPFVARVGSAEISPMELREALFRFLRGSNVPYDRKLLRQLRIEQQILNQLISREIVLQQGRRLGVDATSEEIQEKILTVPAFLEEGNFFLQRYKAILRQNGLTVEQFEESIRYEIMQEKLRGLVTEYVNVSDWRAESGFFTGSTTHVAQIAWPGSADALVRFRSEGDACDGEPVVTCTTRDCALSSGPAAAR